MTARCYTNRLQRGIGTVSCYCTMATAILLIAACASGGDTPSVPWLLAANIRSLVGAPPTPPDFYPEPVRVSDTLKFEAITAGADHTCALSVDGHTYCWGSHQYEQLGTATLTGTCGNSKLACSSMPVRLENAPQFTTLAASMQGTCGLDASGAAYCWGFARGRHAGSVSSGGSAIPVAITGGHEFVALTSNPAGSRACGLTAQGQAWCWGPNGAAADASASEIFGEPAPITTRRKFVSISVGTQHGCGIDETRSAYCWGSNQFAQLGAGASALGGGARESRTPVAVEGGLEFTRIVAGAGHTCALDLEGSAYCWGLGFAADAGRPADPGAPDRRSVMHGARPMRLETTGSRWVELDAGTTQTCGLTLDGTLYCFASTPTSRGEQRRPVRIESDQAFVAFSVGGNHVCAIGADTFAYCWGLSHAGQVGRRPIGR